MRRLLLILMLCVVSGCASIQAVHTELSTYGSWPPQRVPSTYSFERLPSQQAQAGEHDRLERLARPSIEAAGFKASPPNSPPNVSIQIGLRTTRSDVYIDDDPFWWQASLASRRYPYGYHDRYRVHRYPYYGYSWGMTAHTTRFRREAVVLIKDRTSGETLYESHTTSEGNFLGDDKIIGAMFKAAMMDFPRHGINPRPVVIQLTPEPTH